MHKNIMMINATIHIMSLTEKVKSSTIQHSSTVSNVRQAVILYSFSSSYFFYFKFKPFPVELFPE